jgi:hypothetical protein
MIVLHATTEQYNDLNGYYNQCYKLLFAKDALDRWIIGLEVLECNEFSAIHDKLNELERIEYAPFSESNLD